MKTWLVFVKGKYEIVYSVNKPTIGSMVIAMAGDTIWEFDPGFAINDEVTLKVIKGFKIDHEENSVLYLLTDRAGKVTEVKSTNVGHIGHLTNWLYLWLFNHTSFMSSPNET